jgi:hypothetical protein
MQCSQWADAWRQDSLGHPLIHGYDLPQIWLDWKLLTRIWWLKSGWIWLDAFFSEILIFNPLLKLKIGWINGYM